MDEEQSSQGGRQRAVPESSEGAGPHPPHGPRRSVCRRHRRGGLSPMALANEPSFTAVPVTGSLANKGGLDWVSPLDAEPARVAHLLRRATFGATQAELDQSAKDGYAKTVDRLLETKVVEPPVFAGRRRGVAGQGPVNIGQLQQWWVDHMASTPTPFAERMTLFWHGHFTSRLPQGRRRRRRTSTGRTSPGGSTRSRDLRTMLMQVTIDPGMLRYLDLGNSSGKDAERELLARADGAVHDGSRARSPRTT